MDSEVDLRSFYTPLSRITAELEQRRRNKALREKVTRFFAHKPPPTESNRTYAVMSRPVFTPNLELYYFNDLITPLSLEPLLLEYDAKFVTCNKSHYHLCKLHFLDGYDNRRNMRYHSKRIVNFNASEGTCFSEVPTEWGTSVRDFHKNLLGESLPHYLHTIKNFTPWFNETRLLTPYYYLFYLSLFITGGVLFENFLLRDKRENDFFYCKVLPSFQAATRLFGVPPLITPVVPIEEEGRFTWLSYKSQLEQVCIPSPAIVHSGIEV